MKVITCSNIDEGLWETLGDLMREGSMEASRAGDVTVFPGPVSVTLTNTENIISVSALRDANPFFHYFESWWMLAGRNDAAFLNKFVHDFGDRFAEESGKLWGAYGYRWRRFFTRDQLTDTVRKLQENPKDRRVVIQMWSDPMDSPGDKKDHPCNLMICPRIRGSYLDLLIFNRSNDVVWGTFGANFVHFPMMQRWMASQLGLFAGSCTIVSNNMHAYQNVVSKMLFVARGNFANVKAEYLPSNTFMDKVDLKTIEGCVSFMMGENPLNIGERAMKLSSVQEFMDMHQLWDHYKYQSYIPQNNKSGSGWIDAGRRWIERRRK